MPEEKPSASSGQEPKKQPANGSGSTAAAGAEGSASADKKKKFRPRKRSGRWEPSQKQSADTHTPSKREDAPLPASSSQEQTLPSPRTEPGRGRPPSEHRIPSAMAPLGFDILEKHTISFIDGSVRTYYALPPDFESNCRAFQNPNPRPFENIPSPHLNMAPRGAETENAEIFGRFPPRSRELDRFKSFSPRGFPPLHLNPAQMPPERERGPFSEDFGGTGMKRKFSDEDYDPFRVRASENDYRRDLGPSESLHDPRGRRWFPPDFPTSDYGMHDGQGRAELRYGFDAREYDRPSKHFRTSHTFDGPSGDDHELKQKVHQEFLKFSKILHENEKHRKKYLDNGRSGPLQCVVCGSQSKDYPDTHTVVMHSFHAPNPACKAEHLGLHRALCVLMGWNFAVPPDDDRLYQSFSEGEAMANREDLVLWPPVVIIHNTATRRGKDGRMGGIGNNEMTEQLKECGFTGGKPKALYSKEGHLGIVVVKYQPSSSGFQEAERLSKYFESNKHGRRDWQRVQNHASDDRNPDIVQFDEKTKKEKRVLYGYLATSGDLEKVDFETKKKAEIKSRREMNGILA